ncbi:RNA-binding protein Musashi 1 [Haematococcus lacustris]|uniref:RNA-binding protein Musashi 1 n=2 Tax=Haematococcus lacustris TaxID=44745 RepID=A0A699YNZ4_HAELA|nr:RNA-binding protein Musashi 1 [Haematococcus lacustris]
MDLTQTQSLLDHLDISGSTLELAEPPKKLAVLGLPWDTSEETLRAYFAQFGPLEIAEIMKDRYTGKSRGFGFVTFCDSGCAQRALAAEHTIDGRRCEAKVALPKGEPTPPRTTRIFVARIPPTVTESQFRSYFEAYGKLQDAYMPKDHSKQGYRGIGFVTFASPESVEKIMAAKHWMNGQEVAIDRATPKDEPTALKNIFTRVLVPSSQRRSFDNGV